MTLGEIPVGGRLLIRSKVEWRSAVVTKKNDDKVTLAVASPRGRTYRLRRPVFSEIYPDTAIPVLKFEIEEDWRSNFSSYDPRW
jgi:hypothetical protein